MRELVFYRHYSPDTQAQAQLLLGLLKRKNSEAPDTAAKLKSEAPVTTTPQKERNV